MPIDGSGCIITGLAAIPERKRCSYKSRILDEECADSGCPYIEAHGNSVFQLNGTVNRQGHFSRKICTETGDNLIDYNIVNLPPYSENI